MLNSVAEFLGIWSLRGEASLSLNTKDGVTTIDFTHSLSGHPEDPLRPPPAPVGTSRQRRRRRRRGPARRERDRQRAARHQATQHLSLIAPFNVSVKGGGHSVDLSFFPFAHENCLHFKVAPAINDKKNIQSPLFLPELYI